MMNALNHDTASEVTWPGSPPFWLMVVVPYEEANAYLMDNRLIELEVADSSATANAGN
jgi:hypothetical protein